MAVTAETRNSIIELVVTAYDAAPGTTLLTSLVEQADGGASLADIAASLTTSSTFTGLYPTFLTVEEFAEQFLAALVPSVDSESDAYAEGEAAIAFVLNSGGTRADVILQAQTFLAGLSEEDESFGEPAAAFNNKVEVATNHTVTLQKDGDINTLQNVLSGVTSDDDTVTEANENEEATGGTGQTFTLTDELDEITGTSGNDTLKGVVGDAADETTFGVTDDIDLAAGTDTLNVSIIGAHSIAGQTADGVEIINIKYIDDATGANTATAIMSGFADAEQVWVKNSTNTETSSDNEVEVSSIAAGSVVGVANNTSTTNVDFTWDDDATEVTLAAGGGSTGDLDLANEDDDIDTINIATSGSASTIGGLVSGDDFDTVVITGEENLTLVGSVVSGGLDTSVETIDASGFSGNLTINHNLTEDSAVTGGTGDSDILALRVAANVEEDAAISGFETVAFYPTTSATVNLGLFEGAGVWSLNSGTGTTTPVLTLENVAADTTFYGSGAGKKTSTDTIAGLTVELADDDGDSDAVSFVLSNLGVDAGTNDQGMGALTVDGIETLTISANNFDDLDLTSISGSDLVTINYSGDSDLDVGTITAANLEEFDGGSATGDIEFANGIGATDEDVEITTGSGDDIVTHVVIGAGHVHTIDTGDGDDTFTVADVTATAELTVDLGDGDDEVTAGVDNAEVDELADYVIDGGDGNDKITISDAAFEGLLANFEEIVLSATPTADLNFVDGDAGDVTITDIVGANQVINAVDGDLDASGVEFITNTSTLTLAGSASADDIDGGDFGEIIQGGDGNDTLTGGDGEDTFVFEATAAGNDADTITDFSISTDDDLFDFTAYLTTFATANVDAVASATADDVMEDDHVFVVNFDGDIDDKDFGGDEFAELWDAADGYLLTTTVNAEAVVIVQGDDESQVYYVTNDGLAAIDADDVTLVGTVTNLDNGDTLVAADNFAT